MIGKNIWVFAGNTVAVPLTAQRTKPTFQNLVRIRVIDLKKCDFYPFSAS